MTTRSLLVVLALSFVAPAVASAQGGPGFLFKRPRVSLVFKGGYALPTTGGELFDFTVDEFIPLGEDTLSTLGFDSPYLGGELSFRPLERWDFGLSVGWTRSRSLTEYRRWIDSDDNPIEQETTFEVVTGTVGAKYALQSRGRQVGRLAWVPSRLTPWVGAGVGIAGYRFTQQGDFVDTETLAVYADVLETSDEALIVYGSLGADLTLVKNALVTAEARYSYSSADVQGSYLYFNDIDLGGLQLMVGLGFQF